MNTPDFTSPRGFRVSLSKAIGALTMAATFFALPTQASAECVFTEPVTAHGVRDGVPEDSALSSLWPKMATLGGIRPLLARGGIMVSGTYIGEVLGNPSGGVK